MEFRVLGVLEVCDGAQLIEVRPAKLRALLAMLVLHSNQVVSAERLIEALWGQNPPASAANTLQGYVSQLRTLLQPDRRGADNAIVHTRTPGYLLTVEADCVDAWRFERLAGEGRRALAALDFRHAATTLAEALALWRGPALDEFNYDEFTRDAVTRLGELRDCATEDRMEAELGLGHHREVLAELKALVLAAPLRERRWAQLMVGLYRAGHQAEALRSYQDLRRTLAEELGIDPSPDLQRLETAVLAQDAALDLSTPSWVEPAPTFLPPLPLRLRDHGEFPFVARRAALAEVAEEWARAAEGQQRLVLVAGEPGVGKTRLAAEAAVEAHQHGGTVIFGRCDAELAIPFQPFAEALGELVRSCPLQQLALRLGPFAGELARLAPEIRLRLPGLAPPLSSDSETDRYRLFDAVGHWLAALAHDGPVVFVVDDLQWAARPTLLLLRHVLQWQEPLRLLIIGTYRDTELADPDPVLALVGDLRRHHAVARVRLEGLDDGGVEAFLRGATGIDLDDKGRALSGAIQVGTGGNPFFLGEVVRHLRESGGLLDVDGRWVGPRGMNETDIPEGVHDIVRTRVSRLADDTRRMLVLAAVAGDEFELASVGAAGRFEDEDLLGALDEALVASLVVELASSPPRYRFAHAIVRASLYEQLSGPRRLHLHRVVGRAIEAVHGAPLDEHLPQLAHHFAHVASGGLDVEKAIGYLTAAGDRALIQLANDQAATYFSQALALLHKVETGPSTRRCDVLVALGDAQRRAGSPDHRETLLDAARAAQELGDAERLARAALANSREFWSVTWGVDAQRVWVLEAALAALGTVDTPARARLLANLAVECVFVGSFTENRRLSDEALAIAKRLGDAATWAWVLSLRYNTIRGDPGTLSERLENTAELLEVATELGDPVAIAVARGWRGLAAMEAANIDEANRCFDQSEAAVDELRQPTFRWYLTYCQAGRMMLFGRLEEATRLARRAMRLGTAAGHPDAETFYGGQMFQLRFERGNLQRLEKPLLAGIVSDPGSWPLRQPMLALLYQETDRRDDAKRVFERLAADDFASLPLLATWLYAITNCASVCAYLGDQVQAKVLHRLITPYLDQVVTMSSLSYSGSVAHYAGLLAAAMEEHDQAEDHFAAAAAVHERIGAPAWLARTQLERARLLLTLGGSSRRTRAFALLGQVRDVAGRGGFGGVARQARRLLEGEPRPSSLTVRR